eukprot:scaffold14401_cov58-Cyclotella_meneghiniana.AAC.19
MLTQMTFNISGFMLMNSFSPPNHTFILVTTKALLMIVSALEAAKLSLAASTGIPMERWEEFGNIYVEKMRAIYLLEADFNWLNKLIFAKRRMMHQAYDNGMVPVEHLVVSCVR